MERVERVDNFLAHYASANYDPAKAHEYYLKNRELKGRKSTKGMSEVQKQALSYTKHKIGNDKKAELESVAKAQKARLEAIRTRAEETRKRIQEKLNALLKTLEVKPPKKVEPKPVPKPKLMEIPYNASEKLKEFLQKQNASKMQSYGAAVNKAKQEAATKNQIASEEYSKAKQAAAISSDAARKASSEERQRVGSELKTAVANARTAYDKAKKQLIAKYEATENQEYENIRTQLPSAPPPVKKTSTRKKRSTKRKENLQNDSETRL